MFFRSSAAPGFAMLACFGVLAGCGEAPPEQPSSVPASREAPPATKLANLPRDMVAAVSAGKTATSIGVHFALRGAPTVGTPLPVEIAIVPHREFQTVRAQFRAYDGLKLATGDTLEPIEDAEAESVLKHDLVLLPAKEGLFMVTATVETDSDEGNITRVFSIPVIVGPTGGTATPPAPGPAPAAG
jgi:hypothetical protein